jgi:FixJ family two-component response regulator
VPNNPLISVIDDDGSLRRAVVALVRSLGYAASGHASAEDFLATGEIDRSACVITDIQMPGMSGIDLKRALDARNSRVPVIMITARTEEALLERARASGASDLLRKPFDADSFVRSLDRALSGPS